MFMLSVASALKKSKTALRLIYSAGFCLKFHLKIQWHLIMHDPRTSSNALAWSMGPIHQHFDSSWQVNKCSVHLEHRTACCNTSVASQMWCWQSTSCSSVRHMPKNDGQYNRCDMMWCMRCPRYPPNNPNVGINHSKLELITEHLKLPNHRDQFRCIDWIWVKVKGPTHKWLLMVGVMINSPWSSWSPLPAICFDETACPGATLQQNSPSLFLQAEASTLFAVLCLTCSLYPEKTIPKSLAIWPVD